MASSTLYMCGSSIVTSTSSPTWKGSARSSISSRLPGLDDVERVERQRVAALEVEALAGLLLELGEPGVGLRAAPRRLAG